MRNFDTDSYPANSNDYSDVDVKVEYLINEHNFSLHPDSPRCLVKNDMVIHRTMLYNYNVEKLDLLAYLAREWFINDPVITKGFMSEVMKIDYEAIHMLMPEEIIEVYEEQKQEFKEKHKFN
jgi:hypothetical protein